MPTASESAFKLVSGLYARISSACMSSSDSKLFAAVIHVFFLSADTSRHNPSVCFGCLFIIVYLISVLIESSSSWASLTGVGASDMTHWAD